MIEHKIHGADVVVQVWQLHSHARQACIDKAVALLHKMPKERFLAALTACDVLHQGARATAAQYRLSSELLAEIGADALPENTKPSKWQPVLSVHSA